MKRSRKVFFDTLKKSRSAIVTALVIFAFSGTVFYLYNLPIEPFIYAAAFACFFGIAGFIITYSRELSKAEKREQMIFSALTETNLPPEYTLADEDYSETIRLLRTELAALRNEYESIRQDEIDYYTTWAHQIKTPIAVMRMELGSENKELSTIFETELFRIEQYVDMVLQYIKLDSGGSDLVVKEYPLDSLIRETIHKFAPQFVAKRLGLHYDGTDKTVITDKKWFSCIFEQILSNAVKYTPSGSITVSVEKNKLTVADTGIGIAPPDIPRIFEKGYTGENGRLDRRASGLGLYLCKKSADLLCIPISVKSAPGNGSEFTLDLSGKIK